jgi:hypothetical protein
VTAQPSRDQPAPDRPERDRFQPAPAEQADARRITDAVMARLDEGRR